MNTDQLRKWLRLNTVKVRDPAEIWDYNEISISKGIQKLFLPLCIRLKESFQDLLVAIKTGLIAVCSTGR